MQEYLQELVQRIDNRWSVDASDMSTGEWICANTHLRARPFTFDRYPFQKAIADDLHQNMDVVKPSQVGLTEVQIRKALAFVARNRGTSLIFTLPNDDMFERMSTTRILPIVKEEKVFNLEGQSNEKPTRSKGLIQIGTSFMYVTGAKEGDATSISADVVFNDETDLTDQNMLVLFNSRLQNSDWKINQRFSTPTFQGFSIDGGYNMSDQHEYLCRCYACNHWNIPVFSERFIEIPGMPSDIPLVDIDTNLIDSGKIDLVNSLVVCEKCRAPLDLGSIEAREWVSKYASRTHHRGYRVRPFSTDRLPVNYVVQQLLKYKQKDFLRGWYNTVLGEAHTAGNARLTDAVINACFTPHPEPPMIDSALPTWLGIDVGQVCHMIVSQGYDLSRQHAVLFKSFSVDALFDEVRLILDQYNVIGGACDRHPYTPTADALYSMSGGRILPVEYRGTKDVNLVLDPLTQEVTHAQVNRTVMIDGFVKMIRTLAIRFSGYSNQKSLIAEHLKDMVRDENPEKPASWVKLTGNDHFFHAGAFLVSGIRMKELSEGLYGEARSTVAVMASNYGVEESGPLGVGRGRSEVLGKI